MRKTTSTDDEEQHDNKATYRGGREYDIIKILIKQDRFAEVLT